MNKLTMSNIVRSVAYGLAAILVVSGIICMNNYSTIRQTTNGIFLAIILFAIAFLLIFFSRNRHSYKNLEALDKDYTDVKDTDRSKILFSLAITLILLYFTVALSYYDVKVYDQRYPDAYDYFVEDLGVDNTTLAFIKSFPTWISEPLWSNAQTVHDVTMLVNVGADMESDEVTELLDKMDSVNARVGTLRVIALIMTFLFGWFYNYSQRTREYIERRKELVKK